jgi:hypothetical protein
VESDPSFDWNTLKRDEILMTPLLDLRGDVKTPPGFESAVAPFSQEEAEAYPEKFKKEFFQRRKDIRVYGAGGAFEKISKIENLSEIGAKVLNKEQIPPADIKRIRDSNQGIRFIFFYIFAGESLTYSYQFNAPAKKHYVEKTYSATRTMSVKLALWDSKEAKTVWIGEQILTPSNSNTLRFKKPHLILKKIPKEDQNVELSNPDAFDFSGSQGLDYELEHHRSRFPGFLGREPSFSSIYDDFALKLPMNSSEAKLIEYNHFTYGRAELGLGASATGVVPVGRLHFNLSSMIYNFYRFGGDFYVDLFSPRYTYEGKEYKISSLAFGISSDLEWELSDNLRLLTGATFGALSYGIEDVAATKKAQDDAANNPNATDEEKNKTVGTGDGAFFIRPRIKFLKGPKSGAQVGFGAYYIHFNEIEHPILKVHKPSNVGFELSISATSRGF